MQLKLAKIGMNPLAHAKYGPPSFEANLTHVRPPNHALYMYMLLTWQVHSKYIGSGSWTWQVQRMYSACTAHAQHKACTRMYELCTSGASRSLARVPSGAPHDQSVTKTARQSAARLGVPAARRSMAGWRPRRLRARRLDFDPRA